MKRLFTIFFVILSLIIVSPVHAGGILYKLSFVGLWQGIDESDGSEAVRSITLNDDGTFNIIGQEPYTSGCEGERGMITATGVLTDGIIMSDNFTLTCFNGEGPFTVTATYELNKLNGTLIEDIPYISDFGPMILHKISKR